MLNNLVGFKVRKMSNLERLSPKLKLKDTKPRQNRHHNRLVNYCRVLVKQFSPSNPSPLPFPLVPTDVLSILLEFRRVHCKENVEDA